MCVSVYVLPKTKTNANAKCATRGPSQTKMRSSIAELNSPFYLCLGLVLFLPVSQQLSLVGGFALPHSAPSHSPATATSPNEL